MPLNLDARQRAMLQEMGITLWLPGAAPAPAPAPAAALAPRADEAERRPETIMAFWIIWMPC